MLPTDLMMTRYLCLTVALADACSELEFTKNFEFIEGHAIKAIEYAVATTTTATNKVIR